jgi:hypothetical protein
MKDRHREMQDRKTGRQKDSKTERQKDRKTERQKDRKTERQKDRKTERQNGSQALFPVPDSGPGFQSVWQGSNGQGKGLYVE